jgi:hypothetical protein
MSVMVAQNFGQYLGLGTNYVILLVPNEVSIAQFTTLRQARALGVKIKFAGATKQI